MQNQRGKFAAQHPGKFYLDAERPEELQVFLVEHGLLNSAEKLLWIDRAGEGNMNCTLRVRLADGSLIVKQSRPWVEKYPHIAAPEDRILSEARFYMLTSPCEQVAERMPKLLELDAESRVLVLEDVGEACDFVSAYQGEPMTSELTATLSTWLSDLHGLKFSPPSKRRLANRAMRELNHTHIFELPLAANNGLDLDEITPGLSEAAIDLQSSPEYVAEVKSLGDVYLSDGPCLLHGDFFPGSWLMTPVGATIIDPEFAFFGRPEFDVGVFLAHLHLSAQSADVFTAVFEQYRVGDSFDWSLAIGFAGCEIMRRLLGVAQLPLEADLKRKQTLLALSTECVLRPTDCLPTHIRASAG